MLRTLPDLFTAGLQFDWFGFYQTRKYGFMCTYVVKQ